MKSVKVEWVLQDTGVLHMCHIHLVTFMYMLTLACHVCEKNELGFQKSL